MKNNQENQKYLSESQFREFKKLASGLTNKLEDSVNTMKDFMELRESFYKEGLELSKQQADEMNELQERLSKCLDYFDF